MLLAIDVGNTHITMGVFNENELVGSFRLTTKTPRTSDEFGVCFVALFGQKQIGIEQIENCIIASVVPKVMHALNNAVRKFLKCEPMIVGPGTKTGIKVHTEDPKSVGADRIVNAAAVYSEYKKACLVIDFGTATTYDFVSDKGVFEYTVISPGLEIIANVLAEKTAKLPEVEIKKPSRILAKETITSMQAGVVYGYIGQVEYIVKKIKSELKQDFVVIATGGLSRVFENETDVINFYDHNLAFKGMKIIFEKNKEQNND